MVFYRTVQIIRLLFVGQKLKHEPACPAPHRDRWQTGDNDYRVMFKGAALAGYARR